jgi:type IV pilus assembly protein PilA
MAIRKRLDRGFTLIELMLVVVIVGVLAVLAVYGVRGYVGNAKTAEAKSSLGTMGKNALTAYEGEKMTNVVLVSGQAATVTRDVCFSASAKVPATVPAAAKYQSTSADWSNAADVAANKGFPCLRFAMAMPQYYSYGYSAVTQASFTASAQGDLNGNGITSSFTLAGAVVNNRLVVAPAIVALAPDE